MSHNYTMVKKRRRKGIVLDLDLTLSEEHAYALVLHNTTFELSPEVFSQVVEKIQELVKEGIDAKLLEKSVEIDHAPTVSIHNVVYVLKSRNGDVCAVITLRYETCTEIDFALQKVRRRILHVAYFSLFAPDGENIDYFRKLISTYAELCSIATRHGVRKRSLPELSYRQVSSRTVRERVKVKHVVIDSDVTLPELLDALKNAQVKMLSVTVKATDTESVRKILDVIRNVSGSAKVSAEYIPEKETISISISRRDREPITGEVIIDVGVTGGGE